MKRHTTNSLDKDRLQDAVAKTFEEKIPFNRLLGFEIELAGDGTAKLCFPMRDELVGNFLRGNLHGGVISSSLDVVGGLVASLALLQHNSFEDLAQYSESFSRLGTIDLRVDYLRPALGSSFAAIGSILRVGRKIAVTRMALHNDSGVLVAVGTGSYSIS